MIDTIVLTFKEGDYVILDPYKFSPSIESLRQSSQAYWRAKHLKSTQNPTTKDFELYGYCPRLTVTNRIIKGGYEATLRIEFSIPKLIHGNNFVEVSDNDFEKITSVLTEKLRIMGVRIIHKPITEASVSAVHYSKNVKLDDFVTASMITTELKKADITKRLDDAQTKFRNGGHALTYHTNSYEIVFYDKVKDMQQSKISEKRAIEKECFVQLDFFNTIEKRKPQVLRMEVRLGTKTKIKGLLKTVNIAPNLTFKELYSQSVSKKILLHYWQQFYNAHGVISLDASKPEDHMHALMSNNKMTVHSGLKALGYLCLINSIGARGTKALLRPYCDDRTIQRISKGFKSTKLPTNQKFNAMHSVNRALNDFVPITQADFQAVLVQDATIK